MCRFTLSLKALTFPPSPRFAKTTSETSFILDVHLGKLAKFLRMAGSTLYTATVSRMKKSSTFLLDQEG